ncbi:MAG TPA: DUF5666 domain-containing protein [Armatimonadota bacterium]|jgi:hypothetical protein
MFKRIAVVAAAIVGVSGVALAFQAAQPPAPGARGGRTGTAMRGRGRNNGVITAVTGTTYTIKTMRGTEIKASVATDTPVTKPDRSTGAIADLKIGTFVNIQGQPGDDGIVKATAVMIQNPSVMGTIQSVSAKRITVRAMDGKFYTYLVSDKTNFRKAGQTAAWTSFKAGDQVSVQFTGAAALSVRSFQAGGAGGGQRRAPRNGGTPPAPADNASPAEPAPATN